MIGSDVTSTVTRANMKTNIENSIGSLGRHTTSEGGAESASRCLLLRAACYEYKSRLHAL